MKTGLVTGLLAGLTFVLLAIGTPAGAYHTNFQAYCNDSWMNLNPINRGESRNYAYSAAGAGQWGGGCWNTNGYDDSPGDRRVTPTRVVRAPTAQASHSSRGTCAGRRATRGSATTT